MLQILRVNVARHGYTLYSVDAGQVEFLGGEAPPAAEGYEAIANRLDEFLERHGGFSMSFRRSARGRLTFGYACRLAAADEYGRQGLTFLHTAIFDDPALLPSCVLTALASLSGPSVDELTRVAEKLARGIQQPTELLPALARSFEQGRRFEPSELQPSASPVRSIAHDCGGAAALAWSTLAMQQVHAAPPWEVFDTGSASGQTLTRVEPSRGREIPASEVLVAKARPPAATPSQVAAQKPEAPRADLPLTLVAFPRAHGSARGSSGRSGPGAALAIQEDDPVTVAEEENRASPRPVPKPAVDRRLLFAAGLLVLIPLLWTRSAMERTQARLAVVEQERAGLIELVWQIKRAVQEQEEHVAPLIRKEVGRRIEELESQRAEKERERAGFLHVPVLQRKPQDKECAGGDQRGRMSLLGHGSSAKLYVCSSKGWLVFTPGAAP